MPFTAPRYAAGEPWLPGWLGGTFGVTPPAAPATPQSPDEIAAAQQAQKDAENALLANLHRPPGTTIVSHAPEMVPDPKDDPKNPKLPQIATGNTIIGITGPDGQPDSIIVDSKGNLAPNGLPQHTPTKPVTPPVVAHPNAPAGTGVWDPNANDGKGGYTVPVPAKPAAATGPRVDSPSETQTAATGAAAQAETERHNKQVEADAAALRQATANNQTTQNNLAQERLNMEKANAAFDHQVILDGKVTQDNKDKLAAAHQKAQDAQAAADAAETALRDENTRQNQANTLTETTRANTANEANTTRGQDLVAKSNAADLLERQTANAQASADRQQATGAGMIQKHADIAGQQLGGWVNAAAGSKNFGLGGALPANMASGMMGDANNFATQSMGGQSNMDLATQLVHNANPALAKTPQGAGYAAVAAQMLDQHQKDSGSYQAPATDSTDSSNTATQLAAPGVAGAVSPSDPRYLGTVIGQAISHLTDGSPVSRGNLIPFRAPGVTV